MNYGMLPPQDAFALLSAKLHAIERLLDSLREQVAELEERLRETWMGGNE